MEITITKTQAGINYTEKKKIQYDKVTQCGKRVLSGLVICNMETITTINALVFWKVFPKNIIWGLQKFNFTL